MFTRDSRKAGAALAALLTLVGLYAAVVAGMGALANWAERDLHAFPFKDEDWLRYLLPAHFDQPRRPDLLLTGPSTVRENLLYERIEKALPGQEVVQGGISLGTLEDVTAAVDYVRRVHGPDALPRRIVLGVSPRFIANIPDVRPFKLGIDRYSPYVSTRQQVDGIALVDKGPLDGLRARVRFLAAKEPERFRTALLALAYRALAGRDVPGAWAFGESAARRPWLDRLLHVPPVPQVLRAAGLTRVLDYSVLDLLAWRVSPYKYTFNPPIEYGPGTELNRGWWKDVYAWNPLQDWQDVMVHVKRFRALAQACGIDVWVVNLPEREISRAQFDPTHYAAYLSLVRQAFGEDRVIDLRELLATDEFYDREHTLPAGSRRLTDAVIAAMGAAPAPVRTDNGARAQACASFGTAQ